MVIDWQQLALNLRQHKPLKRWSLQLGMHKGYLGQLSRAEIDEPKFELGLQLLDLHLDFCGIDKHKKLLLTK